MLIPKTCIILDTQVPVILIWFDTRYRYLSIFWLFRKKKVEKLGVFVILSAFIRENYKKKINMSLKTTYLAFFFLNLIWLGFVRSNLKRLFYPFDLFFI